MKGKKSEIPVGEIPAKNFRIADDEARPAVHGRFSNNEVIDAKAPATATVAARTPDTPLSEVYADPNPAQETAAIAATDVVVEAPQVNGAAIGATAAGGAAVDHQHDEPDYEGNAADIADYVPEFRPRAAIMKGDVQKMFIEFYKMGTKPWEKMDEYDQERMIRLAGEYSTKVVIGCVNVTASRGFESYAVKINEFTVNREKGVVTAKLHANTDIGLVQPLCDESSCILTFIDLHRFHGDGERIKPSVIGSLGIPVPEKKADAIVVPTSGPGTPTPPEIMDAVGKGLEAAAVAAAVVAAVEPAPAPTTVA